MINILLWAGGVGAIALAIWNVRVPLARKGELDRLADNAKRYESWRGGSRTAAGGNEVTGADVMRDMLRRQIYLWLGVGAVGVVLVIAGFAVR
ncbi:MAG: hypothetical protein ABI797_05320 [Chloroflexota bacterium]